MGGAQGGGGGSVRRRARGSAPPPSACVQRTEEVHVLSVYASINDAARRLEGREQEDAAEHCLRT